MENEYLFHALRINQIGKGLHADYDFFFNEQKT